MTTHAPSFKAVLATTLGLALISTTNLGGASHGEPQIRWQQTRNDTNGYTITPERRALLNTIRFAEGTWKQGQEGYHTLYGGGRFGSLASHPDIVVRKRYSSAAAGAYQFLPITWREAANKLQLRSFNPDSQDQAALYLVDRRGVLKLVDRMGLTREAMAVLAREWASFPSLSGSSAYGQPVKKAEELASFYEANLRSLRAEAA